MGLIDFKEIEPMTQRLNLFVTEDYEINGEKKTAYHKVGVMFPHDKGDGMSVVLIDGLSVSGNLVAFPPKAKDGQDDE